MSKKAKDVIKASLQNMNYIASDEEPSGLDYSRALDVYKSQHAALVSRLNNKHRVRANWGFDDVPDEVFDFVSTIMAGKFISKFPVAESRKQELLILATDAESDLSQLLSKRKTIKNRFPMFPINTNVNQDYFN